MHVSRDTVLGSQMAQRRRDFNDELRKKALSALDCLSLFFSKLFFKRMAQRESNTLEARQCEDGYEARKRKLLIALRRKASEKQNKGD
jgi:hypothetical protein